MSAMASCCFGCEFVQLFLVFGAEVSLEDGLGFVGFWFVPPNIEGALEHAGAFKHSGSQTNGCGIHGRLLSLGSNTLRFGDALPEVFDGLINVPWEGEAVLIGSNVIRCHGGAGVLEMVQELA